MRAWSLVLLVGCSHHSSPSTVDSPGGGDGAAAADAGPDAVPAEQCPGLAYCEDFEHYAIAPIADKQQLGPWTVAVSAVTMTIDPNGYKSGHALRIVMPAGVNSHTGGTPTHGILSQKASGGLVPGNDMFGRAMVFYSNTGGNGLPLAVHSWIFRSGGTDTAAAPVSMNMGGGGAALQLNYSPGDVSQQGGTVTAGAWHCVQWEYNGSGNPTANTAKVWIDGTLAIDIPATKGWNSAAPWNAFDFGFTHYQTLNNPVDVTLDDFALGSAMVPCPQ